MGLSELEKTLSQYANDMMIKSSPERSTAINNMLATCRSLLSIESIANSDTYNDMYKFNLINKVMEFGNFFMQSAMQRLSEMGINSMGMGMMGMSPMGMGNPMMGNPMMSSPMMGSPMMGNPMMSSPMMMPQQPMMQPPMPQQQMVPPQSGILPFMPANNGQMPPGIA